MNTLRLAEETYIDEGKMVNYPRRQNKLYSVIADNDQSTKVSETAKYSQHAYSRLLMSHCVNF